MRNERPVTHRIIPISKRVENSHVRSSTSTDLYPPVAHTTQKSDTAKRVKSHSTQTLPTRLSGRKARNLFEGERGLEGVERPSKLLSADQTQLRATPRVNSTPPSSMEAKKGRGEARTYGYTERKTMGLQRGAGSDFYVSSLECMS